MIRPLRIMTFAALAATTLLLTVACGSTAEIDRADKVFEAPPWQGEESYEYQLSRRDESIGSCTLVTEPDAEPGKTRLSRLCGKDLNRDDGTVLVDSNTLAPVMAERVIFDGEKERRTTYTNTYTPPVVVFAANIDGKENDTTRDLPEATDEMPDPGWYDDESLLWLARGIPLRAGFTGTYAHVINAGLPRILEVDVEVRGPEQVEIGDQTYDAWQVRFERDGSVYRVWVETTDLHRVVRAQIEDVVYELQPREASTTR